MEQKLTPSTPAGPHGYISDKDRYLARLKRFEGQARWIPRAWPSKKSSTASTS